MRPGCKARGFVQEKFTTYVIGLTFHPGYNLVLAGLPKIDLTSVDLTSGLHCTIKQSISNRRVVVLPSISNHVLSMSGGSVETCEMKCCSRISTQVHRAVHLAYPT